MEGGWKKPQHCGNIYTWSDRSRRNYPVRAYSYPEYEQMKYGFGLQYAMQSIFSIVRWTQQSGVFYDRLGTRHMGRVPCAALAKINI